MIKTLTNSLKKYVYEIILALIAIMYVILVVFHYKNLEDEAVDYSYAINLLLTFLPMGITALVQIANKKMQADNIKTKGCPVIIFNSIQEFQKTNIDNMENWVFKARFFDENGLFLNKAKINKIILYKSLNSEYEDYDKGTLIYDNKKSKYNDLEYTPKSENKIDKIDGYINDYYYLNTYIDYDFDSIMNLNVYIKFSIEMNVLTIFGLETKMICHLIFKKDEQAKSRLVKTNDYIQKEVSHRYINYISVDYIG